MAGFDPTAYRQHLAIERSHMAGLNLSWAGVIFDPNKHPRLHGKFTMSSGSRSDMVDVHPIGASAVHKFTIVKERGKGADSEFALHSTSHHLPIEKGPDKGKPSQVRKMDFHGAGMSAEQLVTKMIQIHEGGGTSSSRATPNHLGGVKLKPGQQVELRSAHTPGGSGWMGKAKPAGTKGVVQQQLHNNKGNPNSASVRFEDGQTHYIRNQDLRLLKPKSK